MNSYQFILTLQIGAINAQKYLSCWLITDYLLIHLWGFKFVMLGKKTTKTLYL